MPLWRQMEKNQCQWQPSKLSLQSQLPGSPILVATVRIPNLADKWVWSTQTGCCLSWEVKMMQEWSHKSQHCSKHEHSPRASFRHVFCILACRSRARERIPHLMPCLWRSREGWWMMQTLGCICGLGLGCSVIRDRRSRLHVAVCPQRGQTLSISSAEQSPCWKKSWKTGKKGSGLDHHCGRVCRIGPTLCWRTKNNKALFVVLCRAQRGGGSWAAAWARRAPAVACAQTHITLQRTSTFQSAHAGSVPMCPEAHGSPGRAVGAKRHPGQRAFGFIHFCKSDDGLFESVQLVLSIASSPFLVAASFSHHALQLHSRAQGHSTLSLDTCFSEQLYL